MHVDDLANACEFFLKKKTNHTLINIGSGYEDTIAGYSKFIMKKIDVKLKLQYDKKKPNGTPRKILDTRLSKSYGWKSKIGMSDGFENTFQDYLSMHYKS